MYNAFICLDVQLDRRKDDSRIQALSDCMISVLSIKVDALEKKIKDYSSRLKALEDDDIAANYV